MSARLPGLPLVRCILAQSHKGLALVLKQTGRSTEALRDLDEALLLEKRLEHDSPATPDYRDALAQTHNDRGLVLLALGRRQEAEHAFRQAFAVLRQRADFQQVLRDGPDR